MFKLVSRRSVYERSCNKHPTEEELPRLEEWAWVVQAGACIPLAHTTWAATPGWLVLNILGVYARAR